MQIWNLHKFKFVIDFNLQWFRLWLDENSKIWSIIYLSTRHPFPNFYEKHILLFISTFLKLKVQENTKMRINNIVFPFSSSFWTTKLLINSNYLITHLKDYIETSHNWTFNYQSPNSNFSTVKVISVFTIDSNTLTIIITKIKHRLFSILVSPSYCENYFTVAVKRLRRIVKSLSEIKSSKQHSS